MTSYLDSLPSQFIPWVTWATNFCETLFARLQAMFGGGPMLVGIIIGFLVAFLLRGIFKMLIWVVVAFVVFQYFNAHLS